MHEKPFMLAANSSLKSKVTQKLMTEDCLRVVSGTRNIELAEWETAGRQQATNSPENNGKKLLSF